MSTGAEALGGPKYHHPLAVGEEGCKPGDALLLLVHVVLRNAKLVQEDHAGTNEKASDLLPANKEEIIHEDHRGHKDTILQEGLLSGSIWHQESFSQDGPHKGCNAGCNASSFGVIHHQQGAKLGPA